MKMALLVLISMCSFCLVSGCGGGNSASSQLNVTLTPNWAVALDVSQTLPLTANASTFSGASIQGFDWSLTCGGGNCGTIISHTANGAPVTYSAPAAPPSGPVTITALLTGHSNSVSTTVTVSTPPKVVTIGSITSATLGSPYSFQLAATGGAGGLTWALGGGTSLPDTLSLNGGIIAGTPSGTSGTFNFSVHVTDSGNPPQTSPDVPVSLTVAEPPISVGLSQTSALLGVNGSAGFIATVLYDQQNGSVDWSLHVNGQPCTMTVCGTVSPATTTSGAPITYTAPASVPAANITLTATTVDGTPPATSSAAITITAHGFTDTGSMAAARSGQTATLLNGGRVLVIGGGNASAELFDPATGMFTATTGNMETERAYHTATLLTDGTVLVAGGIDANGTPLATAELFDANSGMFTATKSSMGTSRGYQTASLLNDGSVLVAGGWNGSDRLATAEIFDPKSSAFSATKGIMQTARDSQTATLLKDGTILVTGGHEDSKSVNPNAQVTATAEVYDPNSGMFTTTKSNMIAARANHKATMLNDGTVLITGGYDVYPNPFAHIGTRMYLATAELYDPNSGTFTSTNGTMSFSRTDHTETLLNDGTILVTGGNDGKNQLATAEIYDPVSGSFTRTGDMSAPRGHQTATLLKDAAVLVTGGVGGSRSSLSSAELYK